MISYTVKVPFVPDMGSISPFTAHDYSMMQVGSEPFGVRSDALDQLNRMRDHDGLRHLKTLPKGTTFTQKES